MLRGADHQLTTAAVTVTNTGKVAGDEVVFLFHNASAASALWAGRPGNDGPDPQVRFLRCDGKRNVSRCLLLVVKVALVVLLLLLLLLMLLLCRIASII